MVTDPLVLGCRVELARTEALTADGAEHSHQRHGHRVASESFGGMAGRPASAEIEVRASWTPLGPASSACAGVGSSCDGGGPAAGANARVPIPPPRGESTTGDERSPAPSPTDSIPACCRYRVASNSRGDSQALEAFSTADRSGSGGRGAGVGYW